LPDRKSLDLEIARLRGLEVSELRNCWHTIFRRKAPAHLPRHLLFRTLAYQLQADQLGDLDTQTRQLFDNSEPAEKAGQRVAARHRQSDDLRPGSILGREWKGRMQRVTVLVEGFSWNGKLYPSLTKAALAITGTRWNGPRFFGLRDKQRKTPSP
jgi:hypothetical protein